MNPLHVIYDLIVLQVLDGITTVIALRKGGRRRKPLHEEDFRRCWRAARHIGCKASLRRAAVARNFGAVNIMEVVAEGPYAAARLAIVRAAAEIGRAMP